MLSVIIPCASRFDLLVEQLEALTTMACPEPWEVVVVDNGLVRPESFDAEIGHFTCRLPSLTIVRAIEKRGAGYARNVGASISTGDKLAFLDADDVAGAGWLQAMSRALDEHDVVASRWDVERLNDAGALAARKNGQADGVRSYDYPPFLDHAGGCGLGVRSAAFEAVGGFDEMFILLEDTDLTWRLQLAGYGLAFEPDALVHIRFRQTTRGSFKQAFGYGKYNVLLYKRYRSRGMPKLRVLDGLFSLWKQLKHLSWLRHPEGRARYARSLGFVLGRVGGSLVFLIWGL
ncbi:MAG TPA: glycosyltransferase [Trueperaceae bacterium]|nr:glycosyltransferase [Trueperaceae bacterium]